MRAGPSFRAGTVTASSIISTARRTPKQKPISSARITFKCNARFESFLQIQETGLYEFTITASCDAARDEFAKFNLVLDGSVAGVIQLTAEKPHDFGLTARLARSQGHDSEPARSGAPRSRRRRESRPRGVCCAAR